MDGFGFERLQEGAVPLCNPTEVRSSPSSDPARSATSDELADAPLPPGAPFKLEETNNGEQVLSIVGLAREWARLAQHDRVDIDWVIFVLARHFAATLADAGIDRIDVIRSSIGERITWEQRDEPILADKLDPLIGNDVLAALHHAQARARANGRSESNPSDLLAAIGHAIQSGSVQTAGAQLLRAHWRGISVENLIAQFVARLDQLQTRVGNEVDRLVAERFAVVCSQMYAERRSIEKAVEDLENVSGRLKDLPSPIATIPRKPAPRSTMFAERLVGLFSRRRARLDAP